MSNIRLPLAHCMSRKLNGTHDNDHSYSIRLCIGEFPFAICATHHRPAAHPEEMNRQRNEKKMGEGNQKIHLQNVLT